MKISANVLCYNDAPIIEHFINNIAIHCDEIVVSDGGSSDGTLDILRRLSSSYNINILTHYQTTSRQRSIFHKDYYQSSNGFGFDTHSRRTATLNASTGDYIWVVDTDEIYSDTPLLREYINQHSSKYDCFSYAMHELVSYNEYIRFVADHPISPRIYPRLPGLEYKARRKDGTEEYLYSNQHHKLYIDTCKDHYGQLETMWHLKHLFYNTEYNNHFQRIKSTVVDRIQVLDNNVPLHMNIIIKIVQHKCELTVKTEAIPPSFDNFKL